LAEFLEKYVAKVSAAIMEEPEVLAYLYGRGLTREDLIKYRIGYSKILTPISDGTKDYDDMKSRSFGWSAVKGRIVFPATSCNGKVIGVGLRRLDLPGQPVDESIPRYRNLMTSEAKKVGVFFGIQQAAPHILEKGFAYVVEGAVDCVSLAKALPNTVSTLTSFVNNPQMWTLNMLGNTSVLVFDPDGPGHRGAQKAEQEYGQERIKIRDLGYADPNKCLVDMGLLVCIIFLDFSQTFQTFCEFLYYQNNLSV
jgi:DNA primase